MQELYEFVRPLWIVLVMIVFVGIIVWVMWPSQQKKFRDAAQIPLNDDEPDGTAVKKGN